MLFFKLTNDDKNFWLWSSIMFCDVIDQKLITFASYSCVIILISEKSLKRKNFDQQIKTFLTIHVDFRSFVKSWINITLKFMINFQKYDVIDAFLFNHYIDLIRIRHSQIENWRKYESINFFFDFRLRFEIQHRFFENEICEWERSWQFCENEMILTMKMLRDSMIWQKLFDQFC